VDPVDRALLEADVDPDPIAQFRRWYAEAEVHTVDQPDAMVVATAAPGGEPDARVVLLRGIDERGFSFFTNFESRKGRELRASPRAAALFHWRELGRQVRARGAVEPVADVAADAPDRGLVQIGLGRLPGGDWLVPRNRLFHCVVLRRQVVGRLRRIGFH
jgi:pyridoxine/pyridoxamine 5'-phosphate oxidase